MIRPTGSTGRSSLRHRDSHWSDRTPADIGRKRPTIRVRTEYGRRRWVAHASCAIFAIGSVYATRVLICAGKLVICHHHDLQPPTHLTKVEPECRAGVEYAATLRHAKDTLLLYSPM